MSIRGIISGVAGSAAVALVAALSLGMTRASAEANAPSPAHAQVTPSTPSGVAPALRQTGGPDVNQPGWLHRLLQRIDPAMEATPMAAKRRRS